MKKGLFIVLEGGEGSGKTTLAKNLAAMLECDGLDVVLTREPGGVDVAETIRGVIMDFDISKKTEALLFAAARVEHLNNKVMPAINSGKIVICDRYIDSSIVYQGIAGELGIEEVKNLNNWATNNTYPDLTIYLKLDPKVGLARINSNNREVNRFDLNGLDFHNKLASGYDELFNNRDKSMIVNAHQNQDEIAKICFKEIMKQING